MDPRRRSKRVARDVAGAGIREASALHARKGELDARRAESLLEHGARSEQRVCAVEEGEECVVASVDVGVVRGGPAKGRERENDSQTLGSSARGRAHRHTRSHTLTLQ